jgi:hypothetical protein
VSDCLLCQRRIFQADTEVNGMHERCAEIVAERAREEVECD